MKATHFLLAAVTAAFFACSPADTSTIEIVPFPNDVTVKSGRFNAAGADFHYGAGLDEASQNVIKVFAAQLSLTSGTQCNVSEGKGDSGFSFICDPELPAEAYSLEIGRKAVTVKASGLNGFNYAIQSLKQMLPVEIYGKTEAAGISWTIPCAVINDAPRFGYRGMHLDEARHFFGIDEVKRYLDIMEIHKLNTLHWHITDDQGWRIEIKKYPRLTSVGSIRKSTIVGHINTSKTYDNTPYGEGMWYTQEQIREIIDYAAAKGIRIIPEIDLPGHMLAALAAYPELGCTGGPYEVWGRWGVAEEVLCAGKEETMVFLENVLGEIADLFPAEYIHIGGDECPKVCWEKCPHCQAKIRSLGLKDDDRYNAEHYLQSYVMKRMTDFLSACGKKVIGWDEILEGETAEDAIVMSWRGTKGGVEAAKLGHDAIMTPNTFFYLDYYQALDTENEPQGIGGYLPVEKCYSFEPYAEDITEEQKKHIIGVQANLWTEYITTPEHLEYMLLPRMTALSEVQWCNQDRKSWDRFLSSADHFCAIYDMMGYSYGAHIFNVRGSVKVENGSVLVSLEAQGDIPVRYTLDGSEPTESSTLYEGPVKITDSCILKAKAFRNGIGTKTFTKEFKAHKAMAKDVNLLTEAHRNYNDGLPYILVDGIRGPYNFRSGDWGGWYGDGLEAIIDMKDSGPYSTVTLGAVIVKYDDIFNPAAITVSISEDGKEFIEVAGKEYAPEGENEPNGIKDYSLVFPETSARYLKVKADAVKAKPQWHERPGTPGFVFFDEITVF